MPYDDLYVGKSVKVVLPDVAWAHGREATVEEVRTWGAIVYVIVETPAGERRRAYLRLEHGDIGRWSG